MSWNWNNYIKNWSEIIRIATSYHYQSNTNLSIKFNWKGNDFQYKRNDDEVLPGKVA